MDSIRLKTKELVTYYKGVTKQNVFDSDSLTQTNRLTLIDPLDSQKRSTHSLNVG